MSIEAHGVRATVKQTIIDDIIETIEKCSGLEWIGKNELHSLLGKLNHAAGLLTVMRPFLEPLWAAWAGTSPAHLPGSVWAKQIKQELQWFRTFFKGNGP